MDFFISNAYAQAAGGAAAAPNPLMSFLPLIILFGVFYFMLIRPQSKRAKEHRALLAALEVGTEVATAGGIIGKVTELGDNFVTVEIASNVLVKVQRSTISQVLPKGTIKGS